MTAISSDGADEPINCVLCDETSATVEKHEQHMNEGHDL